MEVAISPELEQFVKELVETGRFASAGEVFEAGILRLLEDDFDDEDLADFEQAEREIVAGETFTVEQLRREFLSK